MQEQSHLHLTLKCIGSCFSNDNSNCNSLLFLWHSMKSMFLTIQWRYYLQVWSVLVSMKFVCDPQIQADQWWLQEASDDPEIDPVLRSTLQNTTPWVLCFWTHLFKIFLWSHVHCISLITVLLTFFCDYFPRMPREYNEDEDPAARRRKKKRWVEEQWMSPPTLLLL